MSDKIKRYYSITDLKDDTNDRMGDKRLLLLYKYLEEKQIKVYQGSSEKEELKRNGIEIINDSYVAYTFIYPHDIAEESDEFLSLERDIIQFACNNTGLKGEEIRARLDYEHIIAKIYAKQLYLTEDVLIPNNSTDYEAYIMTYLNDLVPSNKTLIITDPYLFPKKSDLSYENMIKNILASSKSNKIIAYIPKQKLNQQLFNNVVSHLQTFNIELNHIDRKDFHDRFWICVENVKGFIMGTSLNGLNRRISRVDNLYKEEVEMVLTELSLM